MFGTSIFPQNDTKVMQIMRFSCINSLPLFSKRTGKMAKFNSVIYKKASMLQALIHYFS